MFDESYLEWFNYLDPIATKKWYQSYGEELPENF